MPEDLSGLGQTVDVVDQSVSHQGRTQFKLFAEADLAEGLSETLGISDVGYGQDFYPVPTKDVGGIMRCPKSGKLLPALVGENADLDFAVSELDRGNIKDKFRPGFAAGTMSGWYLRQFLPPTLRFPITPTAIHGAASTAPAEREIPEIRNYRTLRNRPFDSAGVDIEGSEVGRLDGHRSQNSPTILHRWRISL